MRVMWQNGRAKFFRSLILPTKGGRKVSGKEAKRLGLGSERHIFPRTGCTGTLEMLASLSALPSSLVHCTPPLWLGTCPRHRCGAPQAAVGVCCHLQALSGTASFCPAGGGTPIQPNLVRGTTISFPPLSPPGPSSFNAARTFIFISLVSSLVQSLSHVRHVIMNE